MKTSTLTQHASIINNNSTYTFTKAVFGFYHIHSPQYITNDIIKLSIKYLLASDAFITHDTHSYLNILIKGGIDSNICECIFNGIECTIYGRNSISRSKIKRNNYHHWRFRVCAAEHKWGADAETWPKITIGMVRICTELFHPLKKNDIIDMYLNLNTYKLVFRQNNKFVSCKRLLAGDVCDQEPSTMMIKLVGKQTIEMMSYHHSEWYDTNKNQGIHTTIGYMHSVSSVGTKKKLIQSAWKKYPKMNDQLQNELHNAYIDCLLAHTTTQFEKAYDYIVARNLKHVHIRNIVAIGIHFQRKAAGIRYTEEYPKCLSCALDMFLLLDGEDVLIENDLVHIWLKIARCHDKLNQDTENTEQYRTAIKYYNLFVKHAKHTRQAARRSAKCLRRMAEIYVDHLQEHSNALECYFRLDEGETEELEREIAVCYEMETDYINALLWYTKVQNRHPLDTECRDKIRDLFELIHDDEKVEELYKNALETDEGKDDISLHCRYAAFLHRRTEQFEKSMEIYKKALEIYPITYGQKEECYIGLGMVYYKLSDYDEAIAHTKRALFFDDKCAIALNNLGYLYLMRREYELSYEYLIQCIAVCPEHDSTNGYLGNCLYEMKKYDDAVVYLKKSLEKESDLNDPMVGPICLENYANILFMNKEYAECVIICEQLIQRDGFCKHKNKDKIYFLISANSVHLNDLDMALEYGLKAITTNPEEQEYVRHVNDIQQKMNT
eukprot:713483_1